MNAKRALFIISVLMPWVLLLAESGVAVAPQTRKPRSANSRAGDLFRSNCARCHGAEGRGDTPLGKTFKSPDFTDGMWWQEHAEITGTRSLVSIVINGRGNMPAFGKKLNRSEINTLVSYVRRFRDQSGMKNSQ